MSAFDSWLAAFNKWWAARPPATAVDGDWATWRAEWAAWLLLRPIFTPTPPPPPPPPPAPTAWVDDFNGPAGSLPDPAVWGYDLGGGGWFNAELETYTKDPANVSVDGNSHLVISARKDAQGNWTSARLNTHGHKSFGFGKLSIHAKIPRGKGIWTALWMMGENIDAVLWPACGEIDILESVALDTTAWSTLHFPAGPGAVNGYTPGAQYFTHQFGELANDFHTYWVDRTTDKLSIGVDDTTTGTWTKAGLVDMFHNDVPGTWVFNQNFHLILNVAVASAQSSWPGITAPDTSTPAQLLVDWVKFEAA